MPLTPSVPPRAIEPSAPVGGTTSIIAKTNAARQAIRVLVVDDARLFRAAISQALSGETDLKIVGTVASGEEALAAIAQDPPDVVTLDVEMPGMGGLATLQGIMAANAQRPDRPIGVVMVSGHTQAGAEATLKALAGGAFDFIAKPVGGTPDEAMRMLKSQLPLRIRCCALARGGVRRATARPAAPPPPIAQARPSTGRVEAIVIAVSTGGPKALLQMLPTLTAKTEKPIIIVQHMPASFTGPFAEQLGKATGWPSAEAVHGQVITPHRLYIAPGGHHLSVRREGTHVMLVLTDTPPECGVRPAADVLFRSIPPVWGGDVVAVVMTGMGVDGTAGLRPLRRAGAQVVAQDEATSVVWGMPGSAVSGGLVDTVVPLMGIPDAVVARCRGVVG